MKQSQYGYVGTQFICFRNLINGLVSVSYILEGREALICFLVHVDEKSKGN
jgi:hypothetical protein